ncbi:MAG: hypothetical protein M3094_08130, partial [Actinomycetia bacterium]|nr:hypothetical protein [Actinomycetes bacterium]
AICSVWSEFGRLGLAKSRHTQDVGLSNNDIDTIVVAMVDGTPSLRSYKTTIELQAAIASEEVGPKTKGGVTPETMREWSVDLDTGASGLVSLLHLLAESKERSGTGWREGAGMRSAWQPSLHESLNRLEHHLDGNPDVAGTMKFILRSFILSVHPRIAYSKLPEFTFRFRWEEGRLAFYDNGIGRFRLASIRRSPLSQLTEDLGFWKRDKDPKLTSAGIDFLEQAP